MIINSFEYYHKITLILHSLNNGLSEWMSHTLDNDYGIMTINSTLKTKYTLKHKYIKYTIVYILRDWNYQHHHHQNNNNSNGNQSIIKCD